MKSEIYKAGRRTYLVLSKSFPKEEAIKDANLHFKTKKSNLIVQSGRLKGNDLFIEKTGVVWVISKKGKADS